MGLTIQKLDGKAAVSQGPSVPASGSDVPAGMFRVRERMGFTADRSRVVPYESTEAAFLAFYPGQVIPIREAEKWGLVEVIDITAKDDPAQKTIAVETREQVPDETKVIYPPQVKRERRRRGH
jgi:hypothetical protein